MALCESLFWQAGWRNDEFLSRVAASFVSDVEVAAKPDAKSQSEIDSERRPKCHWQQKSSVAS